MTALISFESDAKFRDWLQRNHATADALLVRFYKKASGKGGLTYKEALDEALCFGWIDGVRRSLDEESYSQRFTPRRKRSNWSLVNVKRFEELKAEGRVAPAGQAAFDAKSDERTGISFVEQGDLELGPEQLARLQASAPAWEFWEKSPRSYRKSATWWVLSAKKPETLERRLAQLVECSARGERVPPFIPRRA